MANVFKRARKDGGQSWYIRYKDLDGKDIKELVPDKTKREAENLLAKKLVELANGTHETRLRQNETRFFEIADDFLEYSKANKRSYPKDAYIVKRLKSHFGDVACNGISRSQVERYINARRRGEGGLGRLVEPSTLNRELAALRTIFKRALMDEKISRNPMNGIKLLEEDNVRDRVLTDEEFERLLACASEYIKPIIITAWETGMRRGEILGLIWSQVDLNNGTIRLQGENTKNGRGRVIPISPRLKTVIESLPRRSDYLFLYRGEPIKRICGSFANARNKAGISDFRFHDLRHCFVTRMRCKGVADRVIMAITGHRTFECFRRYDTISTDDLRQAVGAV